MNFFKTQNPTGSKLRELVTYIKTIGRIPINEEKLDDKMKAVSKVLKKYPDCIQIQRAGCHTISNVAMEIIQARMLMQFDVDKIIVRCLNRFYKEDWRICWLGASALWNLARPEEHRNKFSAGTLNLVLEILGSYVENTKVVNTSVGALSNFVLDPVLKQHLGQPQNLPILIQVTNQHIFDENIACTAAGMLANLAVDDAIGHDLVKFGIIETVTNMINLKNRDPTFQRNTVAVLSNCLTSPLFVSECLRHFTVESLFDLQKNAANIGIIALVLNCFQRLDVDSEFYTTSVHAACFHGDLKILKTFVGYDRTLIHDIDGRGETAIIYAARRNHSDIVEYLIKCGASFEILLDNRETLDPKIMESIDNSIQLIKESREVYAKTVNSTSKVCADVSSLVAGFLTPYGMIENIHPLHI